MDMGAKRAVGSRASFHCVAIVIANSRPKFPIFEIMPTVCASDLSHRSVRELGFGGDVLAPIRATVDHRRADDTLPGTLGNARKGDFDPISQHVTVSLKAIEIESILRSPIISAILPALRARGAGNADKREHQ